MAVRGDISPFLGPDAVQMSGKNLSQLLFGAEDRHTCRGIAKGPLPTSLSGTCLPAS